MQLDEFRRIVDFDELRALDGQPVLVVALNCYYEDGGKRCYPMGWHIVDANSPNGLRENTNGRYGTSFLNIAEYNQAWCCAVKKSMEQEFGGMKYAFNKVMEAMLQQTIENAQSINVMVQSGRSNVTYRVNKQNNGQWELE